MMGLLSSIGKFLNTNPVGKAITKTLDTISGIVTNPVTAITQGTAASTKKFVEASPITNAVKTVTNVGLAAAAVVGVGAVAEGGLAAVGSAASKLIPSTTKGKVIAAVATPVVAGAVLKQPAKAAETILNAPSSLANFGGNAAELIANPSLSNAKTLIKENPVVATLAGAGAVAAIGGGVGLAANTVATFVNSRATKANTAATLGGDTTTPEDTGINVIDKSGQFRIMPVEQGAIAPATPITPQTQKVSKSGTVRRRKRKSKSSVPTSISQRVNVVVANKNTTTGISNRRFINREVLLN